jgi:hypothetical protein
MEKWNKSSFFNILILTYGYGNSSIYIMDIKSFFSNPKLPIQRQYEALKAFYADGLPAKDAAKKFKFSPTYFKKLRVAFAKQVRSGENQFFSKTKPGPKRRHTDAKTIDRITMLRKQNHSIRDIQAFLYAENISISLDTIDKILKADGFAPLPKRTRQERLSSQLPQKWECARSVEFKADDEIFTTETNAGPLLFLPMLEKLGIITAIKESGFPKTNNLSDVQMILSFLALKLIGTKCWSHDSFWNMDRALGLFAGLNVLPKSTTLSTYSYRVSRKSNRKLLTQLSNIFEDKDHAEFNLDFKAIPHWGDDSVLEKNWCGTRSKAMKSLLALIVQNPETGNISYTNAEIKHSQQNEAILEFVDFWKDGHEVAPKILIFDSKFTNYKNLNKLNQDNIKFLTLRRRGKNIIKGLEKIEPDCWQKIQIERSKGKRQTIRVYDRRCSIKHYDKELREIIITDHGREKPAFLISNDFDSDVKQLVKKYARRWLVEQEIAEQIVFFHLNHASSSIVVKVDFDLTLTLLAHNMYKVLAKDLAGFEACTVDTLNRKFLYNGARVIVKDKNVSVLLKKKTHLPILLDSSWFKKMTRLNWMDVNIDFDATTVC